MITPNPTSDMKTLQRKKTLIAVTICTVILIAFIIVFSNKPSVSSDPVVFDYEELPVLGDPKAPIRLVEVGDLKCPTCKFLNTEILPQIKKEFVDTGQVALYFFHQAFIAPDSTTAAIAAHSVFDQDNTAFWTYVDALYREQGEERKEWATEEFLIQLAKDEQLPIDFQQFESDLKTRKFEGEVNKQVAYADKNKILETPTIFINGVRYDGEWSYEGLSKAIKEAPGGEEG